MNLWTSIIPTLIGIIAGVTTQYILSFYSEKRKRNADLKMQAYIDFIRGVSELGIERNRHDAKKHEEHLTKFLDAKSRIAIYGSNRVVASIAAFYKKGGKVTNEEERRLLMQIYQNMRGEYQGEEIKDTDLELLIY